MAAHLTTNTDKVYPCTRCGNTENNGVVREGSNPSTKRVKCGSCSFMYSAADSIALETKGELPDGPPTIQEPVHDTGTSPRDTGEDGRLDSSGPHAESNSTTTVPRTPRFVFMRKDRSKHEFCGRRDFRRMVLSWEHDGVKYDVFELVPKSVSAKIDLV